jgi:hypothetical protein
MSFIRIPIPVIQPLEIIYQTTMPALVEYEDLNYNRELREKMIKLFRNSFVEKLASGSYPDVLSHFSVKQKDKVELVKSVHGAKDSSEDMGLKIRFIEEFFLTDRFMTRALQKATEKEGINWYDLYKYKNEVRNTIHKRLLKKIEKNLQK